MKIAIATNTGGLDDTVSQVFARAPTFTIAEIEGGEIKDVRVIQNPAAAAGGGAGIQAAQILINEGVHAVIAGNFGPNASGLLAQTGISMISAPGTRVEDAVKSAEKAGPSVPMNIPPAAPTIPYGPGYGMGYGAGYGMGRGRGMGMGRGRGRGRGMGYGMGYGTGYAYGPAVYPSQYAATKEEEINALEEEKRAIERKLKELKGEK